MAGTRSRAGSDRAAPGWVWLLRRILITLALSAATALAGWLLVERGLGTLNKEDIWGGVIGCALLSLFPTHLGRMMLLPLWWTMSSGVMNGTGSARAAGPYMSLFVWIALATFLWMTYRTVTEVDRNKRTSERRSTPYPFRLLVSEGPYSLSRKHGSPARVNRRIMRGNAISAVAFLLYDAARLTPWFDKSLCLTVLFLLTPLTFLFAWVMWFWVAETARDVASLSWAWPALATALFVWGFYNFKRFLASFGEADGRSYWEIKEDTWADRREEAARSMRASAYRIERAEQRIAQSRRRQ